MIAYRPFKEKLRNLMETVNKALYIAMLLNLLLLCYLIGKMTERAKFDYIGFALIFLISVLMIFNIVVIILNLGFGACRKKEEKEKEAGAVKGNNKESRWLSFGSRSRDRTTKSINQSESFEALKLTGEPGQSLGKIEREEVGKKDKEKDDLAL